MKIKRVYESSKYFNTADIFSKRLSKKFFGHLEEFDQIFIEENDGHDFSTHAKKSFMFYICFTEIHKETVEAMEKFNQFIGRVAPDQWVFKGEELSFDREFHIYDFIELYIDEINEKLEQLEMEENANKYNL
jgi:hypothetical protein